LRVTELVFRGRLVDGAGLREALGVEAMDYIVAGIVSLALCVYLLYALLKPENF